MANHFINSVHHTAGPSTIRRISGTKPGVLDPSQPSRLLRLPGAKLSFASFDPLTAYSQETPDLTKLNINTELYRPKRVVVETAPSGECTWRFVPSAKREEGVKDEGTWPRIVDLCGEFVELSQDQWDIYKLDPFYDCLVKNPSQYTTIRICSQTRQSSPQHSGKRQRNTLSPSPSPKRTMPPPRASPEKKGAFVETDSESDDIEEVEVESMIINDDPPRYRPAKPLKGRLDKGRQERREKLNTKMEKFFYNDDLTHNIYPNEPTFTPKTPERESPPDHGKRKAMEVLDTSWSPDAREMEELRRRAGNYYTTTKNTKRARNVSPLLGQRELERKKLERLKRKQHRMAAEAAARKLERDRREMSEIMKMVPPTNGIPLRREQSDQHMADGEVPEEEESIKVEEGVDTKLTEEEVAHLSELEESRRKLAELERDRPLWEEEAQKRRLREEAEQQALQRKQDERKREVEKKKAEAEKKARLEREQEEMTKREGEKNVRRERELREQERKQRRTRWASGPWTTLRALERYKVLSESFENTKFTPELPLVVDDVPWPVLQPPKTFTTEDVSWETVERFFEAVRPHMRAQDYKIFVEKSHRRFHPDRWRSRNLLKTIEDEALRGCIEVAANTVAQALTPLWRSLTGR